MIWTIIGILVLLWVVGLAMNIAGGLIHILLVAVVIVVAYRLSTWRKVV